MALTLRGLLLLGLVATALLAGGALPASAGAAKCLTCEGEGEGEVEAQFLTIEIVGHGSVKNGTKTYCENASSSSKECEVELAEGKKVTLSPAPLGEYVFQGWSGACSGSGSCEVTMTEAKSVKATFTNPPPAPPTITFPKNGTIFDMLAEEPVEVVFNNSGDFSAVAFLCSLDSPSGGAPCTSPWSTGKLGAGEHTVFVWAKDAAGNVSVPASSKFHVGIMGEEPGDEPGPGGPGGGTSGGGGTPSAGSTGTASPPSVAPAVKIDARPVVKSHLLGASTLIRKLALKRLPVGAKVAATCKGKGCPFKRKQVRVVNGVADLSALFAKHQLGAGALIELKASAPGMTGETVDVKTRAGKAPKVTTS